MTALSACLAALTAWWLVPATGRGRTRLRRATTAPRRAGRWLRAAGVTVGLVALWALLGGGLAAPCVAIAIVVATAGTIVRRRLASRAALREREAVALACAAIASEVAAGRAAPAAVAAVAAESPVLREGSSQLALGGDPCASWRAAGAGPGRQGLGTLAAAWEVCQASGAPLGPSLDAVADALREDRELAHTVAQELAAARATGRLMAALPLVGLLLGYGLGGDPLAFLVAQPWGQACLVAGAVLASAGVLWSERIADRAAHW